MTTVLFWKLYLQMTRNRNHNRRQLYAVLWNQKDCAFKQKENQGVPAWELLGAYRYCL